MFKNVPRKPENTLKIADLSIITYSPKDYAWERIYLYPNWLEDLFISKTRTLTYLKF